MFFLFHLFQKTAFEYKWHRFGWAGCPSCQSSQQCQELKETHSTLPNQWPDLVHSLSITRLQMEETLLHLCRLSNANTRILLGY